MFKNSWILDDCTLHQFGIIKVLLETFSRIKNRFYPENISKFYIDPIIGFSERFTVQSAYTFWLWIHFSSAASLYTYRYCPTGNANFICQRNTLSLYNESESRIFTVECNWRNYSSVVSRVGYSQFSFQKTSTKRDTYNNWKLIN